MNEQNKTSAPHSSPDVASKIWDLWCAVSIIGIWPRYIEPYLLTKQHITVPVKGLPKEFDGFKIFHFSDLHLHTHSSDRLLKKILKAARDFSPDLIAFTGDFICQAKCDNTDQLSNFLNAFPQAPYGSFCIFGNHDYAKWVLINESGDYDVPSDADPAIKKGFMRLFSTIAVTGRLSPGARDIPMNEQLLTVIRKSPFQLLHNETKIIKAGNSAINICGVGEHMLGYCRPEKAFQNYNKEFPGIILAHNPDTLAQLENYPGDLVLMGHTHGGQVNLPWLRNKFILLEHPERYYGIYHLQNNKTAVITRGVGSILNFRWFAPPEVFLITLKAST